MSNVPQIGFGQVRHTRLRPVRNAFVHRTYFLLLPLRTLAHGNGHGPLAINRSGAISFFDCDHGDGRGPAQGGALSWLEQMLAQQGIHDATGEIWLQCYPRVLGYTFKPVSFWFCHRAADDQGGALRAIVVEVNNTFGERHCYLLDAPQWGQECSAAKVFHVSPFCQVQGRYRFRFLRRNRDGQRQSVVSIEHDDALGALLQTSLSGTLAPITEAALRRALWHYPAMTLGVVFHIHWQAARLWLKKVAFFKKPAPPDDLVSR